MNPPNDKKPNSLMIPHTYDDITIVEADIARMVPYLEDARAGNTHRAYASDWAGFRRWAHGKGGDPSAAGPEIVVMYLAWLAEEGLSPSTIDRAYVGITQTLRAKGEGEWSIGTRPEIVRVFFRNMHRKKGRAQRRAAPITSEILSKFTIEALGGDLAAVRNRAILLIGFGAALRESEIIALDREHAQLEGGDLRIFVASSKTDQERAGAWIGIKRAEDPERCPVIALASWLKAARAAGMPIDSGPLFRDVRTAGDPAKRMHPETISKIIRRSVAKVGLESRRYSGHSLRAGFATEAASRGQSLVQIKRQTRHEDLRQLEKYIRPTTIFVDSPTAGIFDEREPKKNP